MEGGGKGVRVPTTKNLLCVCFVVVIIYFGIILVWFDWDGLVVF
jgi:hypothetical protein